MANFSKREFVGQIKQINEIIETGGDVDVYKMRNIIAQAVQTSRHGDAADSSLKLINLCAQKFAHVFVSASGGGDAKDDRCLNHTFTCWCVSRVLDLLCNSPSDAIHTKCHTAMAQLLQLLKWKDPHAYNSVVVELIRLCAELITVSEQLYSSDVAAPIPLKSFPVPADLLQKSINDPKQSSPSAIQISPIQHTITDPLHCEKFQCHVMSILHTLVDDMAHFDTHNMCLLWTSLCCHLEQAEPTLLLVTLKVVRDMLHHGGLPPPTSCSYFMDCIGALCAFLCDPLHEVTPELLCDLEHEMTSVLNNIILANESPHFTSHLSHAHLSIIIQQFIQFLPSHGLPNLKTDDLRRAMSKFVCYVIKTCEATTSEEEDQRGIFEAFAEYVHSFQGDIQFVVGPLVLGVMSEIKHCKDPPESSPVKAKRETTEEKLSLKRPSVSSKGDGQKDSPEPPKVTHLSRIYKSLHDKLIHLLGEAPKPTVEGYNTIAAVVEVASWCSVMQQKYRPSSPLPFTSFLHPSHLSSILTYWITTLTQLPNNMDSDSVSLCVSAMIRSIGSLLSNTVITTNPLPTPITTDAVCLLSLRWLTLESSWHDLKPKVPREMANVASALADFIDIHHIEESLHIMSLLPKSVCPKWRTQVLRLAMTDSDIEVKKCVVRTLPAYLATFKQNAFYLITDLIHPLFTESCITSLSEVLTGCLPYLTCGLALSTSLVLQETVEYGIALHRNVLVQCAGHTQQTDTPTKCADAVFIKPFMALATLGDHQSQLRFVRSLPRVFHHIDFSKSDSHTTELLEPTLDIITHPNNDVRLSLGVTLTEMITDGKGQGGIDVKVMCRLTEVLEQCNSSEESGDIRGIQRQQSVLLVMGDLARLSSPAVLLQVVLNLLDHFHLTDQLLVSTAYLQIRALDDYSMTRHGKGLLMRFRQPICTAIADMMYTAQTNGSADGKSAKVLLEDVSKVLGFSDLQSFPAESLNHLVSHLVSKATPNASKLISLIAVTLDKRTVTKLLLWKIYYIFCYLLRTCTPQQYDTAIKFLEGETKFQLAYLLRMDAQRSFNELLLYISSHRKQVFKGLNIIASTDESFKGQQPIVSSSEMANYLQPRLLGFLSTLDSLLHDSHLPIDEKKLALESLISIMELMGPKHITVVRIKVMASLRIGLQFQEEGFPELCCRAWNCFVKSVDLPSLAPLVPQIVVTLLPLVNTLPRLISPTINFLIVDNRASLYGHFHEIYFLPDLPELASANTVLANYIDSPSSESELCRRTKQYLQGISHETLDIRLHALTKLNELLQSKQKFLHQLIMGSDCADPIISQIVSVLMEACRDASTDVRVLVGQCLGQLGAIDPGRLDVKVDNPLHLRGKFQASITDDNFAFDLINKVVRTFLSASENTMQDCSAYALQQLLTIYEVNSLLDRGRPSGSKLWERFPRDTQDILMPLLTSKYVMNMTTRDWSSLTKPICMSDKGKLFKDWVTNWTECLITKVKQDKPHRVLNACGAVIRYNENIALYLLPHVVYYVLVDGTPQDTLEVCNEIMEVLTLVKQPTTRQGTATDFRHMIAQTVFSILDHLIKWQYHRVQTLSIKGQPSAGDKRSHASKQSDAPAYLGDLSYRAIADFLGKVPQDVLSEASYNCGSYTRALMHYEHYIKASDIQEQIEYVQKLYLLLDEPDGVVGVTAKRKSPPTLQEQILAHESIDQWRDATTCYERAIQLEPNQISHHEGLLKNYMQLGHSSLALVHTSGLLSQSSQWMDRLNSYRVEAAWKLNDWSKLNSFIQQMYSFANSHHVVLGDSHVARIPASYFTPGNVNAHGYPGYNSTQLAYAVTGAEAGTCREVVVMPGANDALNNRGPPVIERGIIHLITSLAKHASRIAVVLPFDMPKAEEGAMERTHQAIKAGVDTARLRLLDSGKAVAVSRCQDPMVTIPSDFGKDGVHLTYPSQRRLARYLAQQLCTYCIDEEPITQPAHTSYIIPPPRHDISPPTISPTTSTYPPKDHQFSPVPSTPTPTPHFTVHGADPIEWTSPSPSSTRLIGLYAPSATDQRRRHKRRRKPTLTKRKRKRRINDRTWDMKSISRPSSSRQRHSYIPPPKYEPPPPVPPPRRRHSSAPAFRHRQSSVSLPCRRHSSLPPSRHRSSHLTPPNNRIPSVSPPRVRHSSVPPGRHRPPHLQPSPSPPRVRHSSVPPGRHRPPHLQPSPSPPRVRHSPVPPGRHRPPHLQPSPSPPRVRHSSLPLRPRHHSFLPLPHHCPSLPPPRPAAPSLNLILLAGDVELNPGPGTKTRCRFGVLQSRNN